ncbi:hypothetical protein GCM10027521_56140 [Amycolatopsis cihanbeyliensis]
MRGSRTAQRPPGPRIAGHTGFVTSLAPGDLDKQLVISFTTNIAVTTEPLFRRLGALLVRDTYRPIRHT